MKNVFSEFAALRFRPSGNECDFPQLFSFRYRSDGEIGEFWVRGFDFKWTVLATYWKLRARTGTKRKPLVSTFTPTNLFSFPGKRCFPNWDKTNWLWIGIRTNFAVSFWGRCGSAVWMEENIAKYRIWGLETWGNSRGVLEASLHQIWCPSGR